MKCTHFWGHISALFALVVCIKACWRNPTFSGRQLCSVSDVSHRLQTSHCHTKQISEEEVKPFTSSYIAGARICKRIRSLGIDSARLGIDSARLGIDFWLLKRFINTGSAVELGGSR